jgi:hypothetical protein
MSDKPGVIVPGVVVQATTASGSVVPMRATSMAMRGKDFPVVWVCTEEDWQVANEAGIEPDSLPWPLTALAVADPARGVQ